MEIGENEGSPHRQQCAQCAGVLLPALPTLSLGACITGSNATACWKSEKEKPREIVDNKLFSFFPGTSGEAIWFANEKIQKT